MTRFLKRLSIVVLVLGLLLRFSVSHRIVLEFIVCVAALAVFAQALRTGKYVWGGLFLSIAVLFSPVAPVALPAGTFFWLEVGCAATFGLSLALLNPEPVLSIQGIIQPRRRIESL